MMLAVLSRIKSSPYEAVHFFGVYRWLVDVRWSSLSSLPRHAYPDQSPRTLSSTYSEVPLSPASISSHPEVFGQILPLLTSKLSSIDQSSRLTKPPPSLFTMDIHTILARFTDKNGIDPDHLDTTTTNTTLIAMQRKYCTLATCPLSWGEINYLPNLGGNVFYLICFFALLGVQLFFGIRHKTWSYLWPMVVGLLLEIIGYIGRLLLHSNPFLLGNFLAYVTHGSSLLDFHSKYTLRPLTVCARL